MPLVWQHEQIEVLVCLDERVHDQQRVIRRHVIVHRTVREQQVTFQVLRQTLICLIVVVGRAVGFARQQPLIPLAPVVLVLAVVVIP